MMNNPDIGSYLNSDAKQFLAEHKTLAEDVENDYVNWEDTSLKRFRLETISAFAEEVFFVEQVKTNSAEKVLATIGETSKQYYQLPSVSTNKAEAVNLELFEKKAADLLLNNTNEYFQQDAESFHYSVTRSLTESLDNRKNAYEQHLIDESRKKFLDELYSKINHFKQLETVMQPILDFLEPGILWDMSEGVFKDYGFDVLRYYSEAMRNNKTIIELAKLLGRQDIDTREVEYENIEQTIVQSAYHPKTAAVGDIVGFEFSGDLNRVVPSEIGQLKEPDTEMLFYTKLIEKKLLSYSFQQYESYEHVEQNNQVQKEKSENFGPIIACIDTSGSMSGAPEITAKTLLLALAKEVIKSHRKCFIISFSTDIETLDVSDFRNGKAMEKLISFLNRSFYGGNDAYPVFQEALRVLNDEDYRNSDVVVVSDFIMPSLPKDILSSIEKEKSKGTNFYSFVIGESANEKATSFFSETLVYNPYSESGRKEFAQKVKSIAMRKEK